MLNTKKLIKDSRGNALFLILIAVALFAALSYAVTQSGRGGSGIDREQAAITAAEMTQYAAGLRTAVMRMTITGVDELSLDFTNTTGADDEVFDAAGGGAISQTPPSGASATPDSYTYLVPTTDTNGHYVDGVGTASADVIVVAEEIDATVCAEINRGLLGSTTINETTGVIASGTPGAKGATTDYDAESGEPYACVDADSGTGAATNYTYYHVLAEQ